MLRFEIVFSYQPQVRFYLIQLDQYIPILNFKSVIIKVSEVGAILSFY